MNMNRIAKYVLLLSVAAILPLVSGCAFKNGGNGSFNPVASDPSLSQVVPLGSESAQLNISESRLKNSFFKKPNARKYTFAAPSCNVSHKFRAGARKIAGCLKISLIGPSDSDNIFITFEKMKVKPRHGSYINVTLPEQEVDLLAAGQLGAVLADAELPEGEYTRMEFQIKKARVVYEGKSYNLIIPSRKIRFLGKFEIKEGFSTEISIRFMFRLLRFKLLNTFLLFPVVRISSALVPITEHPDETQGDITGIIKDFVTGNPISGAAVSIDGTELSAVTASDGTFTFLEVEGGDYTLKVSHADYLDNSMAVQVIPAQVAEVELQMNPAIIQSTVGNTGWFSGAYPLSDAYGEYAEMCLEAPMTIDFVSLAFTKVEVAFDGEYYNSGGALFEAYIDTEQQADPEYITYMGDWWASYLANLGTFLGQFTARREAPRYVVDITDYVRNNPSSAYFFAAKSLDPLMIRMRNVQITIFYR